AMLNGMGTDRSAAFAIEQASIPSLVSYRQRTWVLSWYNVILDSGGALGALAGAFPVAIQRISTVNMELAYRWLFIAYSIVNLCAAGIYLFLKSDIEIPESASRKSGVPITAETKRVVSRISALFSLDAGGGGFL